MSTKGLTRVNIGFLMIQNIFSSGVLRNYLVLMSANKYIEFLVRPSNLIHGDLKNAKRKH